MRCEGILRLALWGVASVAWAQSIPTFQTGATNVLVDVVVIGPHNAPVDGLSRDSFTVLEDGKRQQIVSFRAHSPSTTAPAAQPKLAAGVYTNAQTALDSSVDVLLIDSLNTPNTNQVQTHQKLLAYLKDLPPTQPVAVFLLDTRLRQVEDFTTDHTALLKAVDESTRSPQKSPLLKTAKDTEHQMKDEDADVERPVTRYKLRYDVDASPLQLTPDNGVLQGQLTLVVIAYDRNGTPLNSISNTLALHVPAASLAQFVKQGIQYSQELDVPAQAAWLRAGMLDQNSGQVGSLEVPLATVHEH